MTEMTLRAALLYGVFGLVGFLAQIIAGFELHILPTAAAYWAIQRSGGTPSGRASAPNDLRRSVVYCAWLAGVPGLGAGLFFNAPMVLAAGAGLLFGAVLVSAIDTALMLVARSQPAFVAPRR